MQLYELAEAYKTIHEMLEDSGDEVAPEILTMLQTLEGPIEEQVENIIKIAHTLELEAQALGIEEERIKSRRLSRLKHKESLRAYVLSVLVKLPKEKQKVKTALFTISVAKGREGVIIDNAESIPEEYLKVEKTPMKTKIKAAIDEGKEVPGAHVATGDPTLMVR